MEKKEKEEIRYGALYQYRINDNEMVPVEVVEYDGSSDNIEVVIVGNKMNNMVIRIDKKELLNIGVDELIRSELVATPSTTQRFGTN